MQLKEHNSMVKHSQRLSLLHDNLFESSQCDAKYYANGIVGDSSVQWDLHHF